MISPKNETISPKSINNTQSLWPELLLGTITARHTHSFRCSVPFLFCVMQNTLFATSGRLTGCNSIAPLSSNNIGSTQCMIQEVDYDGGSIFQHCVNNSISFMLLDDCADFKLTVNISAAILILLIHAREEESGNSAHKVDSRSNLMKRLIGVYDTMTNVKGA
uniref:Uncharacterized protein n=1 Tax=Glossina morsitans morsitans TaxID=37546 RepID=A0A1B0FET0_GLOMM